MLIILVELPLILIRKSINFVILLIVTLELWLALVMRNRAVTQYP